MRHSRAPARAMRLALCLAAAAAWACSRKDMVDQPRLRPLQAAPFFANGSAAQTPPLYTVPHGSSGPEGNVPITLPLLARGRERFDIFCAPCHGRTGEGDGMIVRRGFPAPPSLFSARVRADSDSRLYAVITQGYGRMYGYGYRLDRQERIAVVAYLRALQSGRSVPAEASQRSGAAAGDSASIAPPRSHGGGA